jgi:hypothetical protein
MAVRYSEVEMAVMSRWNPSCWVILVLAMDDSPLSNSFDHAQVLAFCRGAKRRSFWNWTSSAQGVADAKVPVRGAGGCLVAKTGLYRPKFG